jgi:osmotically-inducible protein OsmY
VCLGVTLLLGATAFACAPPTNDAVRASLSKDLAKYSGVTVSVDDCVATLTGQVDRFPDKQAATKKAKSYGAISRIVNNITVAGPVVSDADLTHKLSRELAYDRTFQGNAFDWFSVASQNGAVTISGYAHNPMAKESAMILAANTKGVKDLVDQVEVLPVSLFDDQIRIAAFRRIYGGSSFAGANDPEHPIRIIVDNGHVILEGVVISELDRTVAGMKVNGLSGVFSVENKLEVKKG